MEQNTLRCFLKKETLAVILSIKQIYPMPKAKRQHGIIIFFILKLMP